MRLIFDFLNGFHDSSNIVATMISSRAMSPRNALLMSAVAHFVGPFLFGVAVATTIGSEVVDPAAITSAVIIAALSSAILWNLFTWYFGLPSSTSHALIGGLVGAVAVSAGVETIYLDGLMKVLIALFLSPILGLVLGYPDAEADLLSGTGRHAPDQHLVQARAVGDVAGPGTEPRHQRRAKDDGHHRHGHGDHRLCDRVLRALVGDRLERQRHRAGDSIWAAGA